MDYLELALDALRAEQRCRQLEAESAAMRGALEPIYEFIQENIHGDNFKPMIGRAKEALAPDAGKDLLERVQRLEAVAEAAKFLFKLNQHGCTSQIGENELAKALAALEGGAE